MIPTDTVGERRREAAHASRDEGTTGILLAAGLARRMGRPKQILPLAGRPLIAHVLAAAQASRLGEIVVVVGHQAEAVTEALESPPGGRVRIVCNDAPERGLSASLTVGLDAASPESTGAVVLLADQPDIATATIDRVIEAARARCAKILRPRYRGAHGEPIPGHPVWLAATVWPAIRSLRGDRGASALIEAHPDWLETLDLPGSAPEDVDTWQDYRRLADDRG